MAEQDPLRWTASEFRAWRTMEMEWSLAQAATALGVNKSSIVDWEAARYPVPQPTVLACHSWRLADFYDKREKELAAIPGALQNMRPLIERKRAIDNMPGRGRPRGGATLPGTARYFDYVDDQGKTHPLKSAKIERMHEVDTGRTLYGVRIMSEDKPATVTHIEESPNDAEACVKNLGPEGYIAIERA